mgnify:CR=1 FL=1
MTTAIDLDSALDEQHAGVLSMLPPDLMDLSDIPAARARLDALLAMMPAPELPAEVSITEVLAPSLDGAPDVRLKVYTPSGLEPGAGALLWIHGGGMVLMDADGDDFQSATRAVEHRVHEQLAGERRPIRVADAERSTGRNPGPRARTADHDATG